MNGTCVLEARQVSRQYPGTLALDRVDFRLHSGRVSALIGENGAGKSTLVKILAGVEPPSGGTLLLDGREVRFHSVRDADRAGIGMIHQELNLCPNLSIAENIFLACERTTAGAWLQPRAQREEARRLLNRLEHPLDVDTLVGDLPLGEQQIVEIAKAVHRKVRVLMMDEPTSALSPTEIAILFRLIRDLKAHGVAIAYISHRLEELLEIADDITILRDGRVVAEAEAANADVRWIVENMTGRSGAAAGPPARAEAGREVLRAEGWSLENDAGRPLLRDVSFHVRAGEVVGLYGLMGAGRTELLECLMGLHRPSSGRLWLDSLPLHAAGTADRIAAGLTMAPEDRQTLGLIQCLAIRQNVTLSSLRRFARFSWLSPARETGGAAGMVTQLKIKAKGLDHSIGSLSGGNQQKVVIAKCLLASPKVLLLDEPTRGVDVGAKQEIHTIVERLAASGMGILYVSSELEEVQAVSDRILVMSRGSITGEFSRGEAAGDKLASAASAGLGARA